MARRNLIGLPFPKVQAQLEEVLNIKERFRTTQLFHWMYKQGGTDLSQLYTWTKPLREAMAEHFTVDYGQAIQHQASSDGTQKWLCSWGNPRVKVETVFIPAVGGAAEKQGDRGTVCVSSQCGCSMACSFCRTGTQKLMSNLKSHEIVGQLMVARRGMGDFPTPTDGSRIVSNIVMMGQGEPLYNYRNVRDAISTFVDGHGLALGRRRITLSTCGVVPRIPQAMEELGVNLAISLHAVRDELRDVLVPANKQWPLAQLLECCRELHISGVLARRRITFEYVMLKGINDTSSDARELIRILHAIPSHINLIPFNTWPGAEYESSSVSAIKKFADIVNKAGIKTTIRWSKGEDILAACGQLSTAQEVKTQGSEDYTTNTRTVMPR